MLKDNELNNITGGASKIKILVGLGLLISFVAGIIDGFFRPLKCNEW